MRGTSATKDFVCHMGGYVHSCITFRATYHRHAIKEMIWVSSWLHRNDSEGGLPLNIGNMTFYSHGKLV